jgi:hypothetical protein
MPPRPSFREAPEAKDCVEVPPVPDASNSSDTYWVYGWPLNRTYLANQVRRQFGLRRHGYSSFVEADFVIRALRERSGFSHIGIFQCKPRPIDVDVKDGYLMTTDDGSDCISVLAFTCNHKSYAKIRPSPEQMAVWQSALGEPLWIETLHPRTDFPFEAFYH